MSLDHYQVQERQLGQGKAHLSVALLERQVLAQRGGGDFADRPVHLQREAAVEVRRRLEVGAKVTF